jgi:hypothetical protein
VSVVYKIPKTAKFLQTSNRFVATFNVPTPGAYNFAVAANTGQLILSTQPNHLYLLERINVGGTIAEGDFLAAITIFPTATLRFFRENQTVYPLPLSVVNYIDNQEINAWAWSDQGNNSLIVDFAGLLTQTPALVGIGQVALGLTFNIYDITDLGYIRSFKGTDPETFVGQKSKFPAAPTRYLVR